MGISTTKQTLKKMCTKVKSLYKIFKKIQNFYIFMLFSLNGGFVKKILNIKSDYYHSIIEF